MPKGSENSSVKKKMAQVLSMPVLIVDSIVEKVIESSPQERKGARAMIVAQRPFIFD